MKKYNQLDFRDLDIILSPLISKYFYDFRDAAFATRKFPTTEITPFIKVELES